MLYNEDRREILTMHDMQNDEIQRNYAAFQIMLPNITNDHLGEFALLKNGKVVEYFKSVVDADRAGRRLFSDGVFSVQEVSQTPTDLGYFSHVGL